MSNTEISFEVVFMDETGDIFDIFVGEYDTLGGAVNRATLERKREEEEYPDPKDRVNVRIRRVTRELI